MPHDITDVSSIPPASMFLAGRNLALVVLRELFAVGSDRCSIEAEQRPGVAQCDALARAIESLRTAPSQVVSGFAAVFTDVAGCDCSATPEHFELLTPAEMGFETSAPTFRH
ncbi:MAG TPA: hypothetical protein VF453_11145 [Burkholderiaceae bacterium]